MEQSKINVVLFLFRVNEWHKDFDVESCPEVDEEALPPKPNVVAITKVTDFIKATNDAFGGNQRLQQALLDQVGI